MRLDRRAARGVLTFGLASGHGLPVSVLLFLLAFAARLAYLYGFDLPLLATEWSYFQGGLQIAQAESPWRFAWTSDAWREWGGVWVISPLYYLFLAAVFLFEAQVRLVQVLQCGLDATTAVLVASVGRRLEPRHGAWAGVLYAFYWPAMGLPTSLLSENLHTPFLVASFALLLRGREGRPSDASGGETAPPAGWISFLGGACLGLSALARAVSLLFVPVAALWRLGSGGAARRAALLVFVGAASVVLPWSMRNALVIGDFVPIETVAYFNLYQSNSFVSEERLRRRAWSIEKTQTPQARRALAVRYALEGIRDQPGAFVAKVATNVYHFLRPEGLYQLFGAESPRPALWHAGNILLGDLVLFAGVFLYAVFLVAGPPSPGRFLLALWTGYYLFMLLVVFKTGIRYQTAVVPFVLAAAPAALATLRERRGRRLLAVAVGAVILGVMVSSQAGNVVRGLRARWALGSARDALARGEPAVARDRAQAAAHEAPAKVGPLLHLARWLAEAGHVEDAIAVYKTAAERRPEHVIARMALPALLRQVGREDEAREAQRAAEAVVNSAAENPTAALAGAWEWLPPPVTDEIVLGRGDYGAARNFHHAIRGGRWTRHTSDLRLRPRTAAKAYEATFEMGSPLPSPLASPRVRVLGSRGEAREFTLQRSVQAYRLRVETPPDGLVRLTIQAPSWNRFSEPPDRGVVLRRVSLVPAP